MIFYNEKDRQGTGRMLIGRAKEAFNEAKSGALRGRETFVKLLGAQSDLRLAGFDPATDAAYVKLETSRAAFTELLRENYRRAARENYEDSTDERFRGSGRRNAEAISDLHLVPAYMERGGLDPEKEESWQALGVRREDYLKLRRARLVDEAARSFALAAEENRPARDRVSALESARYYLGEAGFDPDDDNAYQALGTTKEQFDSRLAENRQRSLKLF